MPTPRKRHLEWLKTKRLRRYDYKMKLPGFLRLAAVLFFFLLQVLMIALLSNRLNNLGFNIYLLFQLISVAMTLFVVRRGRDINYTLAWSIAILALPFMGLIMYLLWGSRSRFRSMERRMDKVWERLRNWQPDSAQTYKNIDESLIPPGALQQIHYLAGKDFPIYQDSAGLYFPSGEEQFKQLFNDIEKAESFIFLEYFIVSEGHLWTDMEEILLGKAAQGLDVRFMYDDFGSASTVPDGLMQRLRNGGVQVQNFNPVLRSLSRLYVNYRNHQKICVIDGHTAYVGGANLADEYVNIYQRFGYWKDTALRLQGDVVLGITLCFLHLWEAETGQHLDNYSTYLPCKSKLASFNQDGVCNHSSTGVYVHYWDSPLNNPINPAEDMYLSLINSAQQRLYIVTPYFVCDDKMLGDLCRMAESGVDVRLLVPGIADKKLVRIISRSHYGRLLRSGARVFEYSPGFVHSKNMIVDGDRAVVGSINLDYRSLYLNFENAVFFHDRQLCQHVEADFLDCLNSCQELSYSAWLQRPWLDKVAEPFLQIFSPLL